MMQINEYFYHLQGRDLFVHKNHSHNEIELILIISVLYQIIYLKKKQIYLKKIRYR